MYKVAIIIPYFGEFPVWMDLFLASCYWNNRISNNILVDWFIITDNAISFKVYPNTYFIQKTYQEYCEQVSKMLAIDFHPSSPYKLCDLKPFYGFIHKKDLNDYTHWGFGDLDLCYGDLSMLINEKKLNRYKLITTHADRVAGHLTVIRRSSSFSELCFDIAGYRTKLESEKIFGLDEHDYTNLVYPLMAYFEYFYRHFLKRAFKRKGWCIYDFMRLPNIIHNLYSESYIKEYYTSPLPKNGEFWYLDLEKHKIYNPKREELPYLHFLFFKRTPFWETPDYWKPGFYQIGKEIPSKGYIIFDNEKVLYKECL